MKHEKKLRVGGKIEIIKYNRILLRKTENNSRYQQLKHNRRYELLTNGENAKRIYSASDDFWLFLARLLNHHESTLQEKVANFSPPEKLQRSLRQLTLLINLWVAFGVHCANSISGFVTDRS